MLNELMPALTRYADGGDIVAQEAKKEIEKLRTALTEVETYCTTLALRDLKETAQIALYGEVMSPNANKPKSQ